MPHQQRENERHKDGHQLVEAGGVLAEAEDHGRAHGECGERGDVREDLGRGWVVGPPECEFEDVVAE